MGSGRPSRPPTGTSRRIRPKRAPTPRSWAHGAPSPGAWGIVEGGTIPYTPEALAEKQENLENRMVVMPTNDPSRFDTGDPELQCYRPGVPRANYMPFPFQIFQNSEQILITYEYKGALRLVNLASNEEAPADSWRRIDGGAGGAGALQRGDASLDDHSGQYRGRGQRGRRSGTSRGGAGGVAGAAHRLGRPRLARIVDDRDVHAVRASRGAGSEGILHRRGSLRRVQECGGCRRDG